MKIWELIDRVRPLFYEGGVLDEKAGVEEGTLDSQLVRFIIVDFLHKRAEKVKKSLRESILKQVAVVGEKTGKGGQTVSIKEAVATRQRRESTQPDEDKLHELLEKSGLNMRDACDEFVTLRVNPSKIDYLVQIGKLKKEDVATLYGVSWALSVRPVKDVSSVLKNLAEKSY